MYIFDINKETFNLSLNNISYASAIHYWDKLPIINDNKIFKKQIYITDVLSNKQGCGFILMNHILNHFKTQKSIRTRNGYDRNVIWLKVLENNERAFYLYKKCGFIVNTIHYDEYMWMYKIL